MYLYPFLFVQFLELFTCVGHIWDCNGDLVFVVVCCAAVVGGAGGGGVMLVGMGELVLPLVEGP